MQVSQIRQQYPVLEFYRSMSCLATPLRSTGHKAVRQHKRDTALLSIRVCLPRCGHRQLSASKGYYRFLPPQRPGATDEADAGTAVRSWVPSSIPSGVVLCQLFVLAPTGNPISGERLRHETF